MKASELEFDTNLGLIGRESLFELEYPEQIFTVGELEVIITDIGTNFDAAVERLRDSKFNAFRYGVEIAPPKVVTAEPIGENSQGIDPKAVKLIDNPILRKYSLADFFNYVKASSSHEKLSELFIASRVYGTLLSQGARKLPTQDLSVPLWVFAYFYGYTDCIKHPHEP